MFQTPALDVLLTVRENLRLAGALHGLDRSTTNERVESVVAELGITDRLDEQVRRLSGGLARRADLARALIPHPEVLLLDEPTTGLDIDARRSFWESMQRVQRTLGMTVLLATHLIDEAERADRVVMMREGRSVCIDTPEALRASMGDRVLRVSAEDEKDLAQITNWLKEQGLEAYRADRLIISPNASASAIEGCPVKSASLTLAPPTLEDAYSIRTQTGVNP